MHGCLWSMLKSITRAGSCLCITWIRWLRVRWNPLQLRSVDKAHPLTQLCIWLALSKGDAAAYHRRKTSLFWNTSAFSSWLQSIEWSWLQFIEWMDKWMRMVTFTSNQKNLWWWLCFKRERGSVAWGFQSAGIFGSLDWWFSIKMK